MSGVIYIFVATRESKIHWAGHVGPLDVSHHEWC